MEDNFLDKLKKAMMGQQAPIEIPMAPEVVEEAQADAQAAQVNEQAKSPNMMSKPELEMKQAQEQADLTVPGQLQERAIASQVEVPEQKLETSSEDTMDVQKKLRENIKRYEDELNKPQEENQAMNWLTAIGQASRGLKKAGRKDLGKVEYWGDKQKASQVESKNQKLNNLQKLQNLYSQYQNSQTKDGISALDQAKLDQSERALKLKEKMANLKSKTSPKKKNSKLEDEREKAIAKRFATLEEEVPNKLATIDEAKFIMNEIEKGNIGTGPGSALAGTVGSFFNTEESSLKERLDSLAEKAARAQLKANGETRPTDADVEGMKRAMFNLSNTEATNMEKLQDFIKQQESGLDEYNQMKTKLDSGEGLEDFKLKPTYESKDKVGEVKRVTKDGRVAIFDKDTKKFLRYE